MKSPTLGAILVIGLVICVNVSRVNRIKKENEALKALQSATDTLKGNTAK